MGHTKYEPAYDDRRPCHAGRIVGAKALKLKDVWAIRFFLEHEGRFRDRAIFDPAIDSKLRGCDVVKIKIGELVTGGRIRHRAMIVQQKTGRPVQFELLEPARASLLSWLERRGGSLDNFAFPSRVDPAGHLSTRQYACLVDEWSQRSVLLVRTMARIPAATKAALVYKRNGNLRAVQILLGHTKIETTVRYLGVDIEDALALSESTEL